MVYFRDRSLFLPEGAGSYKQNTSQKHMPPPLSKLKKVMNPPFGMYKKVTTPSPYATNKYHT